MNIEDIFSMLNKAQRQAVETIDGPVLVIAGPGTGKTQLLSLRAANILHKTDVLPQNILCLTYTEAATRNMRERMARYIGKQAYDIKISTYHGFGSDIIRANGEYFIDSKAETAIDTIGQYQIMHDIYESLPASNVLWRADTYLKDVMAFISEAKRELLTPKDIRTIARDNTRAVATLTALTTKHLASVPTRLSKQHVTFFDALYYDVTSSMSDVLLPSETYTLDAMFAKALQNALEETSVSGKTSALTQFKNTWLRKNNKDQWVPVGEKETAKLAAAADIYEAYLHKLTEQNLYDYDDMILHAIQGLKQHDELRYSLQEQYQYIMLDEFQDTNRAQLEIIELLTNNPVNEGRPNVLAVGDDDQAIFRFQGAELQNMTRFYSMYNNVTTITLTENWRSHADILHTAQFVSSQIEERLHSQLGFSEKILVAKNPHLPKKATIQRREFMSDVAELDWVSQEIALLCKQGVAPSEIAVIAPKHKYLEPLVPFLQEKGIPMQYDKRENVLDDPRIADITHAVELVLALQKRDHLTANSLWPQVISGAEWGIATSAIWELSWLADANKYKDDQPSDWTSLMLNNEIFTPMALFFTRLALIAESETLETMLDYITGITPLPINEQSIQNFTSPYFSHYFGETSQEASPIAFSQLLSNLTVLRQHIRNYKIEQESPLMLADYIDFIASYRNANEKLLNTSPYHSSTDAVQLLTAYGAKGLEFDVVFILAAVDDVWGMKARNIQSNISLPANMQKIRRAGAHKDERKRLFFVALTRAKHTLYITSFTHTYAGKPTTYLEFLEETEQNGIVTSNALPQHSQTVITSDATPPSDQTLQRFWQTRHIEDIENMSLKDMVRPRLESFQLSATHLNAFTDTVYGGPQSFFINTLLKFPKAPTPDNEYGKAIHETIDAIHKTLVAHGTLPELDDVYTIFTNTLRAKRLAKAEYERQLERGRNELGIFYPYWWPNFHPANKSEERFKDEGVFVGEAHLNGTLDHLLIDHEQRSILVVDFKTGKGSASWKKDAKLHKYRQQLLFYKLLIEGSHTYKKFAVDQGQLVFIQPNDNGTIDELTLDYTKDEIERTKLLIQAVWQRIMNLDFPDISDFSADYKGIIAFENWLIENAT